MKCLRATAVERLERLAAPAEKPSDNSIRGQTIAFHAPVLRFANHVPLSAIIQCPISDNRDANREFLMAMLEAGTARMPPFFQTPLIRRAN
jgi:hypothetical protein